MSENEPEKPLEGWGCLPWSVVGVVLILFVANSVPTCGLTAVKAQQMKASSNARQIIGLLFTYAEDHNGYYPDHDLDPEGRTSNKAFREFVKGEFTDDEMIFGAPQSPFSPDKNLGPGPGFDQAVAAGENHWMMVAGLSDQSPSRYPLVLENAVEAIWPPKWLPFPSPSFWEKISFFEKPPGRGRSWKDGAIIIGHNDASVEVVKLESNAGFMHLRPGYLKPKDKEPLPAFKILDIEEAP